MRIFEYREDLIFFFKSSHGSALNKNVKCFAMQDMLTRMADNDEPRVTAYFGHSSTIQLLLTSLGAFKDDNELTADNFIAMSDRKWQTSRIGPFAANVAVVRYKCPTEDKLKYFLNEKLLRFDWCSTEGVCDWNDTLMKYKHFVGVNCNQIYCKKL